MTNQELNDQGGGALEALLAFVDGVGDRLAQDFAAYDFQVVPKGFGAEAEGEWRCLVEAHLGGLVDKGEITSSDAAAILEKYDEMSADADNMGSIACMEGLDISPDKNTGEARSVDFIAVDLKQAIGPDAFDIPQWADNPETLKRFVTLHELGHTLHSKYYGGADEGRFSAGQMEVIADAFAAAYMKHEMEFQDAFEAISDTRWKDDHPEYPFAEYAAQIEAIADENWHTEAGIQGTMAQIVAFVEANVPGPEVEVRAVAAAQAEEAGALAPPAMH